MITKEVSFKAYFVTCSLLADFQEKGGHCAMMAEEELYNLVANYCYGGTDKWILKYMSFTFGLTKRDLNRALKRYDSYKKERDTV